jgi:hypothetical protein
MVSRSVCARSFETGEIRHVITKKQILRGSRSIAPISCADFFCIAISIDDRTRAEKRKICALSRGHQGQLKPGDLCRALKDIARDRDAQTRVNK